MATAGSPWAGSTPPAGYGGGYPSGAAPGATTGYTPAPVQAGYPTGNLASSIATNGEEMTGRGSFPADPVVNTSIASMSPQMYDQFKSQYPQSTVAAVTAAQKAHGAAAQVTPDQAKLNTYMAQYAKSRQAAQQQIQNQAASSLALLGQTRNAAATAVASLPAAFQGAYKDATGLLGGAGQAAQGALPPDVQAAVAQAMGPENQYLGQTNAAMGSLNPVLNAGISAGANARVGNILSQMMGDESSLNQQDMQFQQGQMTNQQGLMNQEQLNKQNAAYQQQQSVAAQNDTYAQSAGFKNDAALKAVATTPQYKLAQNYLMNGFAQGGNITFDATKIAQHIAHEPNGAAVLRALAANNLIPPAVVKAVGGA